MRLDDRPDPLTGVPGSEARSAERMQSLRTGGTREISGRTRRLVGTVFALVVVGFFVAALAGWIDIVPG